MDLKQQIILTIMIINLLWLNACNNQIILDSWYQDPPKDNPLLYGQGQEIPNSHIYKVVMSKQVEAEKLLQDVSILELSEKQASDFIGKPLPEVPNTKPYLVRGLLYEDNETGKFTVLVNGNEMRVYFGCLGERTPIKRQALVIQLEQMPLIVFVTCSVDK